MKRRTIEESTVAMLRPIRDEDGGIMILGVGLDVNLCCGVVTVWLWTSCCGWTEFNDDGLSGGLN